MKPKHRVTGKQRAERFAREYVQDRNGTQAYLRIFPNVKPRSAAVAARRLLTDANVVNRIAELEAATQAKISERVEVTAAQVVSELCKIAFSDMRVFATWGPDGVTLTDSAKLDAVAAACVAEVSESPGKFGSTIRFKLHDKAGALVSLGRHLGMFNDKLKVTAGGVDEMLAHLDGVQRSAKALPPGESIDAELSA